MTLLYLDVDGVLNKHFRMPNGCCGIDPECVDHLNYILGAVLDLTIVLSSAWRYNFESPVSIMALLMSHGVHCQGRVMGRTCLDEEVHEGPLPNVGDKESWNHWGLIWRKKQIEIHKHTVEVLLEMDVRSAVLDDLPLDVANLVQTDPDKGLTREDAERAIDLLQGRA